MSDFQVHNPSTAPEKSQDQLTRISHQFGFIPNLAGILAESPEALKGYFTLGSIFAQSSFSATEQQIVLLTSSHLNHCHYCMAAHSTIAESTQVPQDVIEALRDGEPIGNAKWEALRQFTAAVVENRGWVDEKKTQDFLDAGYTKADLLNVILGVALKTISNYTNHFADTPVDEPFKKYTWAQPVAS